MKTLFACILPFLLLFVFSCNRSDSKYEKLAAPYSDKDKSDISDSLRLVKTAKIEFRVKDVSQTAIEISTLAKQLNGMVFHLSETSAVSESNEFRISKDSFSIVQAYTAKADMTVRVPAEHLEQFVYRVAELGYHTDLLQLDIDDRSLGYLENSLKQQNRKALLTVPYTNSKKSFSDQSVLSVRDDITDRQISNKAIDTDVKYSLVGLHFIQHPVVRKETVADHHVSQYNLPFALQLKNALNQGWQIFTVFLIVIAHLWIFILTGIAGFFIYRFYKQKRKVAVSPVQQG